jgi:hypothetical protein
MALWDVKPYSLVFERAPISSWFLVWPMFHPQKGGYILFRIRWVLTTNSAADVVYRFPAAERLCHSCNYILVALIRYRFH